MIKLNFKLRGQNIFLSNPGEVVATKAKNYVVAHFDFLSDDWEGLITVIFRHSNNASSPIPQILGIDERLERNECFVPWEILDTAGTVEVSAFCNNLHTVVNAPFTVVKSGYIEGETPPAPTSDVYQQILDKIEELEKQGVPEEVLKKAIEDYLAQHPIEINAYTKEETDIIITNAVQTILSQIPTTTSQLTNDSNYISDENYNHTDNNYTTAEKNKLAELQNYDDTDIRTELNKKANDDELSKVAKSGNYEDLTNKPTVVNGEDGKSAYEIAVEHGYIGTEDEWLESLKSKSSDVYNVKDYGAIGDGITDDTEAFEQCIREANGNLIIVPKGTYAINGCTPVSPTESIAINMIGLDRPKFIRTVVKDPNPDVADDRPMFMFYQTKQARIYGIDFDSQRDNFVSDVGMTSEYIDITDEIEIKGKYYFYKDSGKRIISDDYEGAIIPVTAGEKYRITARTTSTNYLVQFYSDFQYNNDTQTAVGDVVTRLTGNTHYGEPSTTYTDEEITIPEGCNYIGLNSYVKEGYSQRTNLIVKKLKETPAQEWLGTAILYFYKGGANIDIENCSFSNTSREGIFCKGNFENVCVRNCRFEYVSANFWSRLGNLKNFTFENNISHNSRTMAVELDNENGYRVDNVFIRNNTFTDIVKCAIFLRNTHRAVIENNYYDYFDTKSKEYSPYAGALNAAPYFVSISTDDNEIIDLERDFSENIIIRNNRGHAERAFAIFPNTKTKKADGTLLSKGDVAFKNIAIYNNSFISNYAMLRIKCVDDILLYDNYESGACSYGLIWKDYSSNIIAYNNVINGRASNENNYLKNYQDCVISNNVLSITDYQYCDLCKIVLTKDTECSNINIDKFFGKDITLYVKGFNLTFVKGNTIEEDCVVPANSFVRIKYLDSKWHFSVESDAVDEKKINLRLPMEENDVDIEPNKLYIWGELENLIIDLIEPVDNNIVSEYHFIFCSGATPTSLSLPETVIGDIEIEANKIYEVSICENLLTYQSWSVSE